jgi:hypothetical protein
MSACCSPFERFDAATQLAKFLAYLKKCRFHLANLLSKTPREVVFTFRRTAWLLLVEATCTILRNLRKLKRSISPVANFRAVGIISFVTVQCSSPLSQ